MKLMSRVLLTLGLMLATFSTIIASTPPRIPLVQSVDVEVPIAPVAVTIAGRPHLVYELHITNLVSDAAVLIGLDVLDDDRSTSLLSLAGDALADRIVRPGSRGESVDKLTIEGGMRAVVYFWLSVDTAPAVLRHRIAFERVNGKERKSTVIEAAIVNVKSESPAVLAPPLRGGPWLAIYGPQWERGHRRFIYTIDGQARIPARYAIDWIGLDENGSTSHGDARDADNWHGHGAEVLAVADAVVADARDDMPPPESVGTPQANLPLENHSGNYVILDLGDGRHAVYEHLKHGSVRVRTGEKVKGGKVIGKLGNTGSSSSGPHLHFHIADRDALLAAEGLPYVFRDFEVIGEYRTTADARSGKPWEPAAIGGNRKRELPAANTVIMFTTGN